MSKYENFEKKVLEVEYSITAQWDLFKDQAEEVLRNFSENPKELDELMDFFNTKLKTLELPSIFELKHSLTFLKH